MTAYDKRQGGADARKWGEAGCGRWRLKGGRTQIQDKVHARVGCKEHEQSGETGNDI